MSQLRDHLKFTIRIKLRRYFLKSKLGRLGRNSFIEQNVRFLRFPKNVTIGNDVVIKEGARICSCNQNAIIKVGDRSTIGYHTFIFASKSILIGEDCLIAPFVYIVDSNHKFKRHQKISQQENSTAEIVIGDDVWIASNVTILSGVKIGNGAIIAANSVVNTDVSPYDIFAGSPARKIGERS